MTDVPRPQLEALSNDALAGPLRLWQRRRGHRYSLDDLLTAGEASRAAAGGSPIERYLDLGCGIGSVLLMVAYKCQPRRAVGLEAMPESAALAERSIRDNGLGERVEVHLGDLRDRSVWPTLAGPFDLITGTPPYFIPGRGTPSPDRQRCYARFEMRGGVEAYQATAARLLSPCARFVVCTGFDAVERTQMGASAAGLVAVRRCDAYARAGRPRPLFVVWTFVLGSARQSTAPPEHVRWVARDERGARTDAYRQLRAHFDLPPGSCDPTRAR